MVLSIVQEGDQKRRQVAKLNRQLISIENSKGIVTESNQENLIHLLTNPRRVMRESQGAFCTITTGNLVERWSIHLKMVLS